MADQSLFAKESDADIVRHAFNSGATQGAYGVEMMLRLKDAVDRQTESLLASQATTNNLTETIKRLTWWLVLLTVAIVALTVVMAWPALMDIWPKGGRR
jgi:hypothetical protein